MAKSYDPFKIYNLGDPELQARTGLRASSIQDYKTIKAQNAGKGWVDPEFPHTLSSVGNLGKDTAGKTLDQGGQRITFGPVEWIRPKELAANYHVSMKKGFSYPGENTTVYAIKGSVSQLDITQGIIGNCYLLASLGSVTSDPKILNFIVPLDNFDHNDSGVFHFRLWHLGAWIDIVVDDYLPYQGARPEGNQTTWYNSIGAGMVPTGNQLEYWVPLFEKAYAKLAGNYGNISEGCQCINSIQNLTGGFCERYHQNSFPRNLYDELESSLSSKKALALLTCMPPASQKAYYESIGLRCPHAYSITKVARINFQGQDIELVRIYNPHGTNEWKGPWCDNDPNWNSVNKYGLDFNKKDDGEFWMTFDNMRQFFIFLDIASLVDFGAGPGTIKAPGVFELYETTYGTGNDYFTVNVGPGPSGGDSILLAEMIMKVAPWDRTKGQSMFILDVVPADGQSYYPLRETEGTTVQLSSAGLSVCLAYKVQPGKYTVRTNIESGGPTNDYVLRLLYTKA